MAAVPGSRTLAFRGHLREAYADGQAATAAIQPSASPWSGFLDPFLDLSLLGIIPDSLARATFGHSLETAVPWDGEFTPRHLRGLPWWLGHRDTASLVRFVARAAQATRRPNPPLIALRIRLLSAMGKGFLALARGDSATAFQRLQAIPDTLCMSDNSASNCFHLKFTLGRLLAARGEYRQASELLEQWRWDTGGSTPFFVLATLERGRFAERLGERGRRRWRVMGS